MDDARELRKLAEWYRAFAEVGHFFEALRSTKIRGISRTQELEKSIKSNANDG